MALIPIKLSAALSMFIDSKSSIFISSPNSITEAAQKWTSALHGYMSLVSPPAPALQATAQGAKTVMQTAILAAFTSQTFNTLLPTILMTYTTTLALGFAPNYVAIPPVTPPMLEVAFARAKSGGSSKEFIGQLTMIIDAWMRTGTASLITPTGTMPPIPWF